MTFQAMAIDGLGMGAALSRSYELFKQNALLLVVLLIIIGLLNAVASVLLLTCLLTVPYSAIALTIAYEKLARAQTVQAEGGSLQPFSVDGALRK